MDHLLVFYQSEVGFLNKKNGGYLSCEGRIQQIHCRGVHPFFKVKDFFDCLEQV